MEWRCDPETRRLPGAGSGRSSGCGVQVQLYLTVAGQRLVGGFGSIGGSGWSLESKLQYHSAQLWRVLVVPLVDDSRGHRGLGGVSWGPLEGLQRSGAGASRGATMGNQGKW